MISKNLYLIVLFLGAIQNLLAAPVAIADHSFESNSLEPGGWANDLSPDWQESGGPGSGSTFEEYIVGFSADGTDHLGMQASQEVWQDLGEIYQANTLYTLTVAHGNRPGQTDPTNSTSYALADSTGAIHAQGMIDSSTIPAGTFADAPPLELNTATTPGAVGKTIRVLLLSSTNGDRSHFDNIRLDATPLQNQGTAEISILPASGVTAAAATINGEITDIGDAAPVVTFFYGTSDEGIDANAWQNSLELSGTQSGSFATSLSGLNPGTLYFYTARATNSAGDSWALPGESFETLPLPPTVANGGATEVTAVSATLAASVTATGGDLPEVTIFYGTTDGGTSAAGWEQSISLGTLSGAGSGPVSGLSPETTYHFRARGTNAGGESWADTSASFATQPVTLPTIANLAPTGVTGTTASLRGEVTDNGAETPVVTIFYGTTDGGSDAGSWDFSVVVGPENGNFTRFVSNLDPETGYFATARATNSAGTAWASPAVEFTTTALQPNTVVINEIHYDPADETMAEEFIELHNTGDSALDLSGWSFDSGVDFVFPIGTSIAPGGYLVVAEDPSTMLSVHGVAALGPWAGGLNNEGETLSLIDASGVEQDRVSYSSGFPWPTGARGGGGSMELINPSLDNDLAGSWRVSGTPPEAPESVVYIPETSTSWRYRPGTSEASSPTNEWRNPGFSENGSWSTGQTSIGFGDNDDNTVLSNMRFNYSTVYLRHEFTVDPLDIPSELQLRVYVDDGAVVWINGVEVARLHADAGFMAYNATGNNHEAEWETLTIPNAASILIGGTNVLALHALNGTLNSSDFSIDASLQTPDGSPAAEVPTPGERNSTYGTTAPPQIRQVDHTPQEPTSTDDVVISAKVTDPDGVASVSLSYQLVNPGAYIRLTDSAYATNWTTVPMNDAGTDGDAVAGDGIYSATLPASLQQHRRLTRYRITCEDALGSTLTVPYLDDKQPNFAFYTYDTYPSWTGSFAPGGQTQTFPTELFDDLPVYQLVANNTDVINSQYNGGSDGVHMPGTLVYDGKVYDHIEFENRGEASTYVAGKNKWRIHFNRARRFEPRDNWGKKYNQTWTKLNLQPCASPWAAVNRGMAGLDEAIPFRLYGLAGVPSPRTHYFSFRVVDDALESSTTSQYESDLWGLYLAVEQPNGSYLDARDLPDGNVYKIEGGSGDKKEQGDTQVTDSSDWNAFYSASNAAQTEQWWRDNMNMPVYYSMRSLNRYTGNVDIRLGFNHYFYHEPTQDQWWVMPWDLDMMFIAETHQAGYIRQQNALTFHPQLALEFRNRAREISDLVASDDTPDGGQIGQLIDEYAQIVNPTGQAQTWADIDAFMWNYHPRTNGDPNNHGGQSNHKGNFFYSPFLDSRIGGSYVRDLVSQNHEGFVRHLLDYTTDTFTGTSWVPGNGVPAGYGYEYLNYEAADANIPATPTLAHTGAAGYPVNDLTFESGAFSDPNGNNTFGKMSWRIAEIAAPGVTGYVTGEPRTYEIETVHQAESASFVAAYTFPPNVAVPGHTYRVRVRHEDITGRTSHWSEAVEFVAEGPDISVYANALVVTELMYHPADPTGAETAVSIDGRDFEFIELRNVSPTVTLDLTALSFTDGIDFDFANASQTLLGPGEYLVLASNQAAFEARYGTAIPVAGIYTGALSNGGEQVTISYATNTPVRQFTYSDADPWPTEPDGDGVSLILVDPASVPDHSLPESWMAGGRANGTPGTGESPDFVSWQAENFSPAELQDADISGPDADPDGDGLVNLLEFAMGLDPHQPDAGAVITGEIADDGGTDYLTIRFRRLVDRTNLNYGVEVSTDLLGWSPSDGEELSVTDNGDGTETVIFRSDVPVGEGPEFLRLSVTIP